MRENADLFDEWLQASLRGPSEALRARPELQEIFAVQREVRAAYLAATREGHEELDLTEAQLQAWLARLPGRLTTRPWSYDVFAQAAVGGTETGLIVNQVYAGYGQYFSRFLSALPAQVTADVRATLTALAPAGHSQLGLRSAHGFTANLHPALTDTEVQIDAPVDGPALSVNDLYLEHDEARDEVVLRRRDTGESVQIVYAGFLIAQLLPSLKNFLVTLTNNGLIVPHLPDIAEASLGPAGGQIRRTPRLRAGPVVLHRARWSVPHAALPAPGPHATDAEYALTLWRWAADHGLPPRCSCAGAAPRGAAPTCRRGRPNWPAAPRNPSTSISPVPCTRGCWPRCCATARRTSCLKNAAPCPKRRWSTATRGLLPANSSLNCIRRDGCDSQGSRKQRRHACPSSPPLSC
ncbi:lantibiotic dehydratase [Deinococcus multiflagellatus]|uniref:Lantibiotic dehydratase n=1 Tax=Deinococcus multiflagellatus TaxID=1656887 RepID=A0ABW1ZPH3_9DEIO